MLDLKLEPGILKQLIEVLRRIADGIDRAYPPKPDPVTAKAMKPHGPDDLVVFQPEDEWLREEEEEARQS